MNTIRKYLASDTGPTAMLLTFVSVAILASCDEDTGTGDLEVQWTIGLDSPTMTECSDKGISTVVVSLYSSSHNDEMQAACEDGSVTFQNIPKVDFRVAVIGLDEADCPVYSGETTGVEPSDGEEPTVSSVTLQRLDPSGSVHVSWSFAGGGLCGTNEVDVVHVTVLAEDVQVFDQNVPCSDGLVEILAVGAGSIDVRVEADSADTQLCDVQTNLTLAPCSTLDVDAILAPCS